MMIVDCEVYANYFLVMFKNIDTGKSAAFDMFEGQPLNINRVKELMAADTIISYNGNSYDLPVIADAIAGASCERLKKLSDDLIKSKLPAWRVARDNKIHIPAWDHIDLIEVAPGKASLKIYGGRMNAKKMQDLPIAPGDLISSEQREQMKDYCLNDLDTSELLYRRLEPQIRLREQIGKQYGDIDLRSKSDAQIAEKIIKHELEALTGKTYKPRKVEVGHVCRYSDPKIVSFATPGLRETFARI